MLSYYLQLREHMRSAVARSAGPERDAHPQQHRSDLICEAKPAGHLPETTGQNVAAHEDTTPAEAVDLDNAFEAMTEEMKFDWPASSHVDRITAGLIQSTVGLLLFLALIAASSFLYQTLIHKL